MFKGVFLKADDKQAFTFHRAIIYPLSLWKASGAEIQEEPLRNTRTTQYCAFWKEKAAHSVRNRILTSVSAFRLQIRGNTLNVTMGIRDPDSCIEKWIRTCMLLSKLAFNQLTIGLGYCYIKYNSVNCDRQSLITSELPKSLHDGFLKRCNLPLFVWKGIGLH